MQEVVAALAACGKRVESLQEAEADPIRRLAFDLVLQNLLTLVRNTLDLERVLNDAKKRTQ